jgi:hypothetical protein
MFQVFKKLPLKESTEYCSKMTSLVQKRKIQSVSIDQISAKNNKASLKKPSESLIEDYESAPPLFPSCTTSLDNSE